VGVLESLALRVKKEAGALAEVPPAPGPAEEEPVDAHLVVYAILHTPAPRLHEAKEGGGFERHHHPCVDVSE